jgi:hypothetical protein
VSEHSPLPWKSTERYQGSDERFIASADGRSVDDDIDQVDAEFIVRAVNSHGALVAALQGLILEQSLATITQARKALKEAGL